ncbi:MAG: hypothetical protein DMD79_08565 [Candidatus Rokuibacteriota bacterium]|nr:MAG: hypothetical protein DMD79_08565 [Candidatus Rokubacteria bacterium]
MFLTVALAVTVPFLALTALLAYGRIAADRARIVDGLLGRAAGIGAEVERHLGARLAAITGAATAVAASPAVVEAQARWIRQAFPDVERVFVVDEVGAPVVSLPSPAQEWFKRAVTSPEAFVGVPTRRGPDVIVGLYAPARTSEGSLRGVVAAELSLGRVQELLARAGLGAGSVVELLSDRGVVVARHPALFLLQDQGGQPEYVALIRRGGGATELTFEDGDRRLVGAAPVNPMGWLLVVGLGSAQVLGEARRHLVVLGGVALLVGASGVVAALVVGRRTTAGLAQLGSAMSRVEAGDLPAALPVAVGGEAGALTESFNRMLTRLHRRIRDYEVLSQVEEAAVIPSGGSSTADRMMPGLLRRVVGGMGADVGVLLLEEESFLVTRALVGFPDMTAKGDRLRRGKGLAGAVLADGAPVVVTDVGADSRVEEPYFREAGIRAVAGVPMTAGDQVLGVLEVGYRLPHVFADGEIERLSAMAQRAAQAIERARAVESVQRNTQGLEARLAQQLEALQQAASGRAEADRQTRAAEGRAEELERKIQQQADAPPAVREVVREVVREDPAAGEQARLRLAMQKTVTEELRAPLGALLDLPRLLVDGLQKPLGDEDRRELEILQERSQEIVELIESLALLTGLAAGRAPMVRAPVDLSALVGRVVRALQPRAAAKGNRIDVDVKPGVGRLSSDARRIEQVLTGLLLTAIRYTEVGEIHVTCYLREPDVVLTVADDGVGFTSEEQARIFEPFLAVGPRGERPLPGTGLSLAACQRLVEALGGKIRVESEVDRGTWFTVTLPIGG